MERANRSPIRLFATVFAAGAAVLALGACSSGDGDPDVVAGKQLFVQKCGACHVLSRANTKGTAGPDLDSAFAQSRREGFGESAIRGVVKAQIANPYRGTRPCQPDCVRMPAGLVKGDDAENVAAYVALAAGSGGKDEGLLATAVQAPGAGKPAAARNGVLTIAADPNGQLAYATKTASAPAGALTIRSPNESSIQHDIVIDGKGHGQAVADGGVSQFKATFSPGKYTYYCSLPGHRQAGMEGTLTVR